MKKLLLASAFAFAALLPCARAEEEPKVARAVPVETRDITTQLQIFLDQQLFGPGAIDGRPGEFVGKALRRYQRAHGLPDTGILDANIPLDSVFPIYTTYTIKPEDFKFVGPYPSKPSEQAKLKKMLYPDVAEFISERYHVTPTFLGKLNPTVKLDNLKAGDTVRVPNVEPFVIESLPSAGKLPVVEEFKHRVIKIHRGNRMLELYDGEKLIASVPITPGVKGGGARETPAGKWRIVGMQAAPNFRWDKGVLDHGKRTENFFELPPGPRNPVGVLWIGLNKPGIGIHGTSSAWTIGRATSHGCMRVSNWDVVRLSKMITEGMTVVIE